MKIKLLISYFTIIIVLLLIGITVNADETKSFSESFVYEKNPDAKIIDTQDKDSLNTITVENGDGTNTSYIINQNVRYYNEKGDIVEKDLSLVENKTEDKEDYTLSVKSNDIVSKFPENFKTGGLKVDKIEVIPIGAEAQINDYSSVNVTYEKVFEGVNLTCCPELNGLSVTINATDLSKIENIEFEIKNQDEFCINNENGIIYINNSKNEIYELSGSQLYNDEGDEIGVTTLSLEDDNRISMAYELYSDYSLSVASTSEVSTNFYFYKNTYYEPDTITVYSNENFGISDDYNYLGTYDNSGTDIIARTFIRFDLSELSGIEYDRILSAFYSTKAIDNDSQEYAEVYLVAEEWDKDSISWTNMPECNYNQKLYVQDMKYKHDESETNIKYFYITSAVQAWLQGLPNNGIMLKASDDNGWFGLSKSFSYLTVNYSNNSKAPNSKGVDSTKFYYVLNKNSKKALSTSNMYEGAQVFQKTFSLSEYQQWNLIYATTVDGIDYFHIKTEPYNYFLKANTSVVYNESVRITLTLADKEATLWQVKRNWDGTFKIIPKLSSGSMALSVYDKSLEDNALVFLDTQTVDFSKEDDWTLIPVDRENAAVYGSENNGSDLYTVNEVTNVFNNLTASQYDTVINVGTQKNETVSHASKYIEHLFNSQIWYSSDHGSPSRMYFFSKETRETTRTISAIGPFTGVEQFVLDDDDHEMIEYVDVYGITDYDGNLNGLQLAIMNSCEVGSDNGSESLVGLMYEYGAHCIVSQTKEIDAVASASYYDYFSLALHGSDVDFALKFADRMKSDGGVESKHIFGDKSIFYNYEAIAEIEEEADNSFSDYIYVKCDDDANLTDDYYAYFGSDGNLYGYRYSNNKIIFFARNHRSEYVGNNIVNREAAISCANLFLEFWGYDSNDYTFTCSNDYSSEFKIEYTSIEDTINIDKGEVTKFHVIVEEDENDNPYVTFFKAVRK